MREPHVVSVEAVVPTCPLMSCHRRYCFEKSPRPQARGFPPRERSNQKKRHHAHKVRTDSSRSQGGPPERYLGPLPAERRHALISHCPIPSRGHNQSATHFVLRSSPSDHRHLRGDLWFGHLRMSSNAMWVRIRVGCLRGLGLRNPRAASSFASSSCHRKPLSAASPVAALNAWLHAVAMELTTL